jgi:hypothetical protein
MLAGLDRRAGAAEFHAVALPNDGGPAILMTGVIAVGDEVRFHALAATLSQAIVITTGPGGSVYAALMIGSETRSRGWSTLVPHDAQCASACSLIWLAGTRRLLGTNAEIGFHAMSMLQNARRTETHDYDGELRSWLNGLGYALDATATIVNTHAASIRWYDGIELRANGIPNEPWP